MPDSVISESEAVFSRVASYFSVLSEPLRLKIINIVCRGERTVGEIAEMVESSQANVSKHLQILTHAGVISRRKEGTSVIYSMADKSVFDLCRTVCNQIASNLEGHAALHQGLAELAHEDSWMI